MKYVLLFFVFCIALELSLCRLNQDEEELENLLKRMLKKKPSRLRNGKEKDLEKAELDPESSAENAAERQTVDTKKGKLKPKNIRPYKKKFLMSQSMDNHLKIAKIGKVPPGDGNGGERSKRNFEYNGRMWPNGIVPYEIDYASYPFTVHNNVTTLVSQAANIIQSETCVTWKPRSGEQFYVRIQNGAGCSSYIGNVKFDEGYQNLTLKDYGCLYLEIVIHEMLHAMGARHEQSRMDRPRYMEILWDKIKKGRANNFDVADTKDTSPYDLSSVMQYGLQSFGANRSTITMKMADPELEYLITNGDKTLTLYDIADINDAYQCTASCSNTCDNGGVVKQSGGVCSCACPSGLTGPTCSQLDTSPNCGGVINLPAELSSQISFQSYSTGLMCTWLVKGPTGTRIKAAITSMDLPYSSQQNCFHWLEFRDSLIGQLGKGKCGDTGGSQFVKSLDGDPNMMMIRFDSKTYSGVTPGSGFSVSVQAYTSGCIGYPCKNGGTCTETANSGFVCTCTNGWSGSTCEHISATATNKCSLSDDVSTCAFKQDTQNSNFKWTIGTEYYGLDPALVLRPMKSGIYYYGWKSYLITTANFAASARCFSFKYKFPDNHLTLSWPSSVIMYIEGSGMSKAEVARLTKDTVSIDWTSKSVSIPSMSDLKVTIEGIIGRQAVSLDDLVIKPGSCDDLVPCVDSNPCLNGGTCVPSGSIATCLCDSCMYSGQFCQTTLGHLCGFESSSCFLQNSGDDDFDWSLRTGNTPSSYTGPSSAFEGQYYLYMEASSPREEGERAVLVSNVAFESKTYCLRLKYHMWDNYNSYMGTLKVLTKEGTDPAAPRWWISGNQGNSWRSLQLTLSLNSNTKILIEAVRGSHWSTDIAIDDVKLSGCAC